MDKTAVIIPAAGKGRRMNSEVNKQYILLKDKPILAYTLEIFDKHPLINEIIVVTANDEIDYCKNEVIGKYNYQKKIKVVAGGKERQDSVYNGLKEVENSGLVIVHDGARPFLSQEIVTKVIEETKKWYAVAVGMPVKDTIKSIDWDNFVTDTPDRSTLWLAQTPQSFSYDLFCKGHEQARKEGFYGTDDTMLVERLGYKIKMTLGSYENIKVTTSEDLTIGEAILEGRK